MAEVQQLFCTLSETKVATSCGQRCQDQS
jgi:hypothetical protein